MSSTVSAVVFRTDTVSNAKQPISSRKENEIGVRFEIAMYIVYMVLYLDNYHNDKVQ